MSGSRSAQLESKREEFRKYLENEGVLEYLTKSLVSLYEADRPKSALDYLKNNFSGKEQEVLQMKVDNLTKENDILVKENRELKQKIEELEKEKADLKLKASTSSAAAHDKDSVKDEGPASPAKAKDVEDKAGKENAAEEEPMDTTSAAVEDSAAAPTEPEKPVSDSKVEKPEPESEKAKVATEETKRGSEEAPTEVKAVD